MLEGPVARAVDAIYNVVHIGIGVICLYLRSYYPDTVIYAGYRENRT